ncbi:MAG: hypothetical protein ACRYG4_17970 [Janthinobacterium lividum]
MMAAMHNRLKDLGAERGWNQTDLAERLEVLRRRSCRPAAGGCRIRICVWVQRVHARSTSAVYLKNGEVVDESGDPALRSVFAADIARLALRCLSELPDWNGAGAAYVADAARAGHFDEAWAAMPSHYEHGATFWEPCNAPVSSWTEHCCPEGHTTHFSDLPQSLRAFYKQTGYLPS